MSNEATNDAALTRVSALTSTMQITDTDSSVKDPAQLENLDGLVWIPAVMPGGVHESLIAAGKLRHPYRADFETESDWVPNRTWWYRGEITIPASADNYRITIDGIDTVADIWLDHSYLGHHQNQFLSFEATVPSDVQSTATLWIRVSPPLEGLSEPPAVRAMVDKVAAFLAAATPGDAEPETASGIMTLNLAATRRRKAMFSWGWDFAPTVPSIGVSGPITLSPQLPGKIDSCNLYTHHIDLQDGTAKVTLSAQVSGDIEAVLFELTSPDGQTMSVPGRVVDGKAEADLDLIDVRPWWTHDLGRSDRYQLVVTASTSSGTLRLKRSVGVRTIKLDVTTDDNDPLANAPAKKFQFQLNGVPIFARGANLVPESMLLGSVTAHYQRKLVELSVAGQMNMIRVWGGGRYATEAFLDACDELGVLVWEDFMFACVDYPEDDEQFMADVRAEAEAITKRMAHHPCLAVFGANNEASAMHQAVYGNLDPGPWGYEMYHHILPTTVAKNVPGVAYWPGSPYGDAAVDPRCNGVLAGDRHAWEVWHGADIGAGTFEDYQSSAEAMHFRRYQYDAGRFISEFGIHASADEATLTRWLGSEHMRLTDPVLLARNKDVPKDKGAGLIELEIGQPTDVRSYVLYSQAVQAEGLKFGIEHYRRRQPHCSGALIWQLNEPWPGMTWSILDHDLGAKPGYYAASRAFSPVLASFISTTAELQLWLCNSTAKPAQGVAQIRIADFESLPEPINASYDVAPGSATQIWSTPLKQLPADGSHLALVSSANDTFPDNRLFFTRIGELNLPDPMLHFEVARLSDTSAKVTIHNSRFAYFVRVLTPWPGVRASSGALDLLPGSHEIILTDLPDAFAPDQVEVRDFTADRASQN